MAKKNVKYVQKFGKAANDIMLFSQNFYSDDFNLWQNNMQTAEIYNKQPKRLFCKNCSAVLGEIFFTKQSINYYYCDNCKHLNGEHEDTVEFANALYIDSTYAESYSSDSIESYISRVKKIYLPKAEFLQKSIENINMDIKNLSITDIGCGAGYFIYALTKELGCKSIKGYEISKKQCDYANKMLGNNLVQPIEINNLVNIVKETKSDIVSFIGVLEHLTNPSDILQAIKENNNIKFCYISVPLFSFSTFFEAVNQDSYNRNLGDSHTHLYTNESIDWICKNYNFEIISKWHFGGDMIDLYRFMSVKMSKSSMNKPFMEFFKTKFLSIIDKMQLIIDESEFCSEVHVIIKKIN